MTTRVTRWLQAIVVGVVPTAALSLGVMQHTLNHFFSRAPYLLDSGWYSAIIYRAGLFPDNPQIACNYAASYFGIHFSPIVSAFSLLSYLAPVDRIEWYALFQGLVYVPAAIATYYVASRVEPETIRRRLPITVVAAIAFAFNGSLLSFIGYPHYEAAIGGLICLAVAAVVLGRTRAAWVFIALVVCVREDAGFHTALALAPVAYLKWRGVEMPASLRAIVKMMAVAAIASVVEIALQKLIFHPANLLRLEYLGDPMFDHVRGSMLADRARSFVTTCQHIYYPFVGACVIATVRRDARYLLGWAVTLPWFAINFFAVFGAKASFVAYTGFPFVASLFWVYLYAAKLARRRLHAGMAEALLALLAVSSIVGAWQGSAISTSSTVRDMAVSHPWHRAKVHAFVDALGDNRARLGTLLVDPAVAAIAIESVEPDNIWRPAIAADVIAFHREAVLTDVGLVSDLVANHLDVCTVVLGTKIVMCARDSLAAVFSALDVAVIPAPLTSINLDRDDIHVTPRGLEIDAGTVGARLGVLRAGSYELTVETVAPVSLHVGAGTVEFATAEGPHAVLTFTADGVSSVWLRAELHAPLIITAARLRHLDGVDR